MYKYRFPDGSPCPYPTSYEHACEVRSKVYDDRQPCSKCGHKIKYTKTQGCKNCAKLRSINLIHLYKGYDNLIWTDENGRHWGEPQGGRVEEIPQEEWDEMLDLIDIANSGPEYTITDQPCATHGHYSLKRLGKCYQCQVEKSKPTPRQEALQSGKTWYTPPHVCPKCGHKALKNVHNGSCQGCVPPRDAEQHATAEMMKASPDTIISREDARSLDMKVYRTGEACSRGHKDWRYVSTGNCVQCLKGEK